MKQEQFVFKRMQEKKNHLMLLVLLVLAPLSGIHPGGGPNLQASLEGGEGEEKDDDDDDEISEEEGGEGVKSCASGWCFGCGNEDDGGGGGGGGVGVLACASE